MCDDARVRAIEHLTGKRFWVEFDRGDFGVLVRELPDHMPLIGELAAQLAAGSDNLTVLLWAIASGHPMAVVTNVLELIDIHHRRKPFLDDDADPPHIVPG